MKLTMKFGSYSTRFLGNDFTVLLQNYTVDHAHIVFEFTDATKPELPDLWNVDSSR